MASWGIYRALTGAKIGTLNYNWGSKWGQRGRYSYLAT